MALGLTPLTCMNKLSLMECSNKKNYLVGICDLSLRLSFPHALYLNLEKNNLKKNFLGFGNDLKQH